MVIFIRFGNNKCVWEHFICDFNGVHWDNNQRKSQYFFISSSFWSMISFMLGSNLSCGEGATVTLQDIWIPSMREKCACRKTESSSVLAYLKHLKQHRFKSPKTQSLHVCRDEERVRVLQLLRQGMILQFNKKLEIEGARGSWLTSAAM